MKKAFVVTAVILLLALGSGCASEPIVGKWHVDLERTLNSIPKLPDWLKPDYDSLAEYKVGLAGKLIGLEISFTNEKKGLYYFPGSYPKRKKVGTARIVVVKEENRNPVSFWWKAQNNEQHTIFSFYDGVIGKYGWLELLGEQCLVWHTGFEYDNMPEFVPMEDIPGILLAMQASTEIYFAKAGSERNEILAKLRQEIAEKARRIDPPIEKPLTMKWCDPDGEITSVGSKQDICIVDIGQEDGAKTGLIFEVFKYVKGGRRKCKGRIEIKKIEDNSSQAVIIEALNPKDPIIKGDHILSPLYDKKEVQTFIFAGELTNTKFTKKDIAKLIEEAGAKVVTGLTVETDFLVAGKGGKETGDYQRASDLGIVILSEQELLKYLCK